MTPDSLGYDAFCRTLHAAFENFKKNRRAGLDQLSKQKSVIVYSYGTRGWDLANQLRRSGVECVIFDNSKQAVARAAAEGFATTSNIALDLPVIVAAGQNQLSILSGLTRPAYTLAEGLYAYDLINQCEKARKFSEVIPTITDQLYQLYGRLDANCSEDLLNVLLFRISLDVRNIAPTRKPVSQMWTPPAAVRAIRSFCDVGAYDGDTLISMKALFSGLESTFAVEPNADLVTSIEAAAQKGSLKNKTFTGAAWSHKTRLSCKVHPNGMMVITEDTSGTIDADALDNLTSQERYDYVKFDVEGAEAPALKGAHFLLQSANCIAIASYHLPSDLVDIPNHISMILGAEYAAGWRCAFQHYSECFDDSILYFYRAKQ
jgi:FkbM family methyltransferase